MPHITIEYTIMIPVLILQIFLFPLTASWLMNIWVDSRRTLVLQDAAGHLGSIIQQLYFSLNHDTITSANITCSPGLPPFIEDKYYSGTAVLESVGADVNSGKVLKLTMTLTGTKNSVTTSVILGPNARWVNSTFYSNSTSAVVSAGKVGGLVYLQFGE
ncbi:MAG: hypothetical protein QHH24_06540 [Candidatus Bathyarchaeota archaeon]|jgi:hypothetical protein|nr:hypothetical protein [Candidatus Bathyarchaeota archaeon]